MDENLPKNEQPNYTDFLDQIAAEISSSLQPEEKQLLPDILKITSHFYTKLEVGETFTDFENPEAIISARIAIALGYQWLQNKSSYSKLEAISEQLLLLFSEKNRTYVEDAETGSNGALHDATAKKILQAAFPDQKLEWESEPLPELLTKLTTEIGNEGILRLPYSVKGDDGQFHNSDAAHFLESVYAQNESIPPEQHKLFGGLYNQESGTIILWKDSNPHTEIHERFHLENAGLLAGNLGYVLNEGMTDMLTHKQLRDQGSTDADIALLRSKSNYIRSVQVVEAISDLDPQLGESLLRLYQSPTKEDAEFTSNQLIKILGLDLYANLYTSLPKDNKEAEILNLVRLVHEPERSDSDVPKFMFEI